MPTITSHLPVLAGDVCWMFHVVWHVSVQVSCMWLHPNMKPQVKKSLRSHTCCPWKCWLQQLSTLVIIFLPGSILTRLFNELLHLISLMLLALLRWHTLVHRTSRRHNIYLPRKIVQEKLLSSALYKMSCLKSIQSYSGKSNCVSLFSWPLPIWLCRVVTISNWAQSCKAPPLSQHLFCLLLNAYWLH